MYKILFVESSGNISGGQKVLLRLLRNFPSTIEPVVVCPEGSFAEKVEGLGICVRRRGLDSFPLQYNHVPIVSPAGVYMLGTLAKELKVDIIHSNNFYANKYGAVAGKLFSISTVWTVHNVYHLGLIDKFLIKNTDAIIAVSEAVRKSYAYDDKSKSKIKTIYNGVNPGRFSVDLSRKEKRKYSRELGIVHSAFTIGIIAQISKKKGHIHLFESVKFLEEKFGITSQVLVVGGDYEGTGYMAELKDKVAELYLDSEVVFTGFRKDVINILQLMDVVVLPSVKGEGLPLVLLEAMAASKPVISSDIAGTGEIINHGKDGFLFSPGDSKKLGHFLEKLYKDRDLRERISASGKSKVKSKFSVSSQTESYVELYKNIIERPVNS